MAFNIVKNKRKIYLKTYGCQMNVYDSEKMLDQLTEKGFEQTSEEENADLIILNTCHIREKAAEKVYSDIGRINKIFEIIIIKGYITWFVILFTNSKMFRNLLVIVEILRFYK